MPDAEADIPANDLAAIDPLTLLPPVTGIVGAGGASGTSLPVTGVAGFIQPGMTITGTGIPANTTVIKQIGGTTPGGAGTYRTSQATTAAALDSVTFTAGPSLAFFPAFKPIAPPPVFGANKPVPNFPPPTPPPAGAVPIGSLIGPVVAPAAVPPSVAGIAQPVIGGPWVAVFPGFQTVSPSPPIVFTNTMMIGNDRPPQTPTTQNILIHGFAPPPVPPVINPPGEPEPEPEPEPEGVSAKRRTRRKSV